MKRNKFSIGGNDAVADESPGALQWGAMSLTGGLRWVSGGTCRLPCYWTSVIYNETQVKAVLEIIRHRVEIGARGDD